MDLKFYIFLIVLKLVTAKISIEVNVDNNNNVTLTYSGIEIDVITNDDVKLFKIEDNNLKAALKQIFEKEPSDIFLKSPTPWGNLYKLYKWEEVTRVLAIKSARVAGISKQPVVVLSKDFENLSEQTIKVNTGISHSVQNTLTTTWSKSKEFTVSREIPYDVNVIFTKIKGSTGYSYTTNWGVSEKISKTVNISANGDSETELKPGQAVTAVLSANAGYIDIEVVHSASLKGNLAVNFNQAARGHHHWGPPIQSVMKSGSISNEVIAVETIKFEFYVDPSLKVFNKSTGLPVL